MNKDALIVTLSDLHSGGSTALFPNRFWQFRHTNYTPTSRQLLLWEHFEFCAEQVAQARKGKIVTLVHNGDAVDGNHHHTPQIVTQLMDEQRAIHEELMLHFTKKIGFSRGDRLYYVKGTEVHTGDEEDTIGRDMGAVESAPELYAFNELELEINTKRLVWVHHGPSAGKGANRGNALRNWLRNIFYDQIAEGKLPPHYVISGHTHDPDWNAYNGRLNGGYHQIQGLICPSWQERTRFGYKVAPVKKNKIGLQFFTITKDGIISDPVELLML